MRAAVILFASVLALGVGTAVQAADSTPDPQKNTSSQPVPNLWPEDADADGDNMISHDEAMLLSERTYSRYDYDASGDITMQEWRMVIDDRIANAKKANSAYRGPGDIDTFTSKTFYTHDTNRDDVITRAEWDDRVGQHFTGMDLNGDGMIDQQEAGGIDKAQKKGD